MAYHSGKRQHISQHIHHGKVQRDVRIDNVRGILIILVVIGHFLLPLSEANTRLISGALYLIYVFHMPCFVMLSGYYAKSVYKNGRFRWGKAVQIFWLYLVYEVIVFFTEWLAYGYTSPFPNLLRESGAPWYLLSLSTWYMTIPLFNGFRGKKSSVFITAAMFIAVAFLKYAVHFADFLALDRTISFFPFFYLGFFSTQSSVDRYLLSNFQKPVNLAAMFFSLLVFIGAKDLFLKYRLIVYGADYIRFPEDMQGTLWLVNLIWNIIALVISLGLISFTLNRRMMILTDLGKNTLQIYFLHRPIRDLMMYAGFYQMIDPYNRFQILLLIIFSIILTIVLGIGFISVVFGKLRSVFDPLLEKYGGL